MSVDVWSEPLLEPPTNTTNAGNPVGAGRQSERQSLFLSDSEEEYTSSRKHTSAQEAPSHGADAVSNTLEPSQLDAMFADLDEDADDVFRIAPTLDIEKMKRQADARVAADAAAAGRSLASSLIDGAVDKSVSAQNKDRDPKAKKATRVVAKLDEERLLSTEGFPQLIRDSKNFRITGKGHEVADLERLFRLYHGWTHRLFPKLQFRDTVERVEKLCRSRRMGVNMRAWKNEANGIMPEVRHEVTQNDNEEGDNKEDDIAPIQRQASGTSSSSSRPSTPITRPSSAASSVPSSATHDDGIDADIDALLREEEEMMREIHTMDKQAVSYKPPDDEDMLW